MKARREAYEERLQLQKRVAERKQAEEKAAVEDIDRRNAMERLAAKRDEAVSKRKAEEDAQKERRRQAEEVTRRKQEEAIRKREAEEEKKR